MVVGAAVGVDVGDGVAAEGSAVAGVVGVGDVSGDGLGGVETPQPHMTETTIAAARPRVAYLRLANVIRASLSGSAPMGGIVQSPDSDEPGNRT